MGKVAAFSTKLPYVAVAFAGLVCCLTFFYNHDLSFNDLKEVDPSYPSIKGYSIVSEHFSAGESMPLTIAVKGNQTMNNQSDLATLNEITEAIKGVRGVKNVYSVTQPKAKKINNLYIGDQAKTLNDGLGKANNGIIQIRSGLNSAVQQLQSATQSSGSLGKLQNGTMSLVTGLDSVTTASGQLSNGLQKLQDGSNRLSSNLALLDTVSGKLGNGLSTGASVSSKITQGISKIQTNLTGMQTMLDGMISNYQTMKTGLTGIGNFLSDIYSNMTGASKSLTDMGTQAGTLSHQLSGNSIYTSELSSMTGDLSNMENDLGSVGGDAQKMKTILQAFNSSDGSSGLSQAQTGLTTMLGALNKLESAGSQLSSGLLNASNGQQKITNAIAQLDTGAKQLNSGLTKISYGQTKITGVLSQLGNGAAQIQSGQSKLIDGIEKVLPQAQKLSNGLNKAVIGLNQISGGLGSANKYLDGLTGSSYSSSIFYIPDDKINAGNFVNSMNTYMSANRKIAKFTVTLNVDPYSNEAMDITANIHAAIEAVLKNSSLRNATYGISGITQSNLDLRTMSDSDFSKARIIMLAGIFILLLIVTRSFWLPVFVMAALTASYFIAISLSGLFFNYIVNEPQLSWLVPFCSFIMIIALGVDYSIFLITRHNENGDIPESESIVIACRKVGGVITSAALILSGTFAAMYPSGVITLMEIAVTVIFGLILLCFVFLPLAIPALVSLKAKAGLLEFRNKTNKYGKEKL